MWNHNDLMSYVILRIVVKNRMQLCNKMSSTFHSNRPSLRARGADYERGLRGAGRPPFGRRLRGSRAPPGCLGPPKTQSSPLGPLQSSSKALFKLPRAKHFKKKWTPPQKTHSREQSLKIGLHVALLNSFKKLKGAKKEQHSTSPKLEKEGSHNTFQAIRWAA